MTLPVRTSRAPHVSRSALLLLAALAALPATPALAQDSAAPETPAPATTDTAPPEDTGLTPIPEPPPPPTPVEPPPSPVADIVAAPPAVTPYAEPLSLESAIAQALDANFDIQIQRNVTKSTVENEEIARSIYDPTLSASAGTGQRQTIEVDANGNIAPFSSRRTDTDSADVSLSQRIPLGTVVTGSSFLDRNDRNHVDDNTLDPSYSSGVSLSVSQPLLRGAGASINNAAIERARLGTKRAHADFAASVFTVVRDVEVAYANLALAREFLGIRAFSLEVRKKLFEENRTRRETGVATDLEVLQAEVGVATAARDLLLARQDARDREDELLRLLGHETFENPVGPVTLPPAEIAPVDLAASLTRARSNTPELTSALAAIQQQEIDIRTARNDRLPDLNLDASAGYSGTDADLRGRSSNLWTGEGYNWSAGLRLTFPWGFRAEKARLRQARAGREREELRLAQTEQDILVSVRNAVRDLETSLENLRLSSLAATLSGREFEVEKARYDSGLSTFRRVQEAQDDYDQARLSELQAKVNLRTAQANLDRLEGTAPARYNLTLTP